MHSSGLPPQLISLSKHEMLRNVKKSLCRANDSSVVQITPSVYLILILLAVVIEIYIFQSTLILGPLSTDFWPEQTVFSIRVCYVKLHICLFIFLRWHPLYQVLWIQVYSKIICLQRNGMMVLFNGSQSLVFIRFIWDTSQKRRCGSHPQTRQIWISGRMGEKNHR